MEERLTCEGIIKGKSGDRICVLLLLLVVHIVPQLCLLGTGSCAPLESSAGLCSFC